MSRTSTTLFFLTLTAFSFTAAAQTIDFVYPRFAVAGVETRFTATGSDLPTINKSGLGIKFSTVKPAVCEGARRYKPQTKKRYYFACSLQDKPKVVKFQISNTTKRSGTTLLWEGNVQVLDAPPSIGLISVLAGSPDGQSQIICLPTKPCVIIIGKLQSEQGIAVELEGQNLPATLQWSVGGCRSISNWGNPENTTTVKFDCSRIVSGQDVLSIFTAPKSEGGQLLYSESLPVNSP